MDLFYGVCFVVDIFFVLRIADFSQWVQRRSDSQVLLDVNYVIRMIKAVTGYFSGWLNCTRWNAGLVMWLWTFCWIGLIAPPILVSKFHLEKSPHMNKIVALLVVYTILIAYFSNRFFRAGKAVTMMWENPNHNTVSKVISYGDIAVPHLLEVLDVGDIDAITAAADALVKIGAKGVARTALYRLTSHPDPIIRSVVERGLRLNSQVVTDFHPDD